MYSAQMAAAVSMSSARMPSIVHTALLRRLLRLATCFIGYFPSCDSCVSSVCCDPSVSLFDRLRVLQRLLQCVGRVEMEFRFSSTCHPRPNALTYCLYMVTSSELSSAFHALHRADRRNFEWRRILSALQKQNVAGAAYCGVEQYALVHDLHGLAPPAQSALTTASTSCWCTT